MLFYQLTNLYSRLVRVIFLGVFEPWREIGRQNRGVEALLVVADGVERGFRVRKVDEVPAAAATDAGILAHVER